MRRPLPLVLAGGVLASAPLACGQSRDAALLGERTSALQSRDGSAGDAAREAGPPDAPVDARLDAPPPDAQRPPPDAPRRDGPAPDAPSPGRDASTPPPDGPPPDGPQCQADPTPWSDGPEPLEALQTGGAPTIPKNLWHLNCRRPSNLPIYCDQPPQHALVQWPPRADAGMHLSQGMCDLFAFRTGMQMPADMINPYLNADPYPYLKDKLVPNGLGSMAFGFCAVIHELIHWCDPAAFQPPTCTFSTCTEAEAARDESFCYDNVIRKFCTSDGALTVPGIAGGERMCEDFCGRVIQVHSEANLEGCLCQTGKPITPKACASCIDQCTGDQGAVGDQRVNLPGLYCRSFMRVDLKSECEKEARQASPHGCQGQLPPGLRPPGPSGTTQGNRVFPGNVYVDFYGMDEDVDGNAYIGWRGNGEDTTVMSLTVE
jgi:hypothetical protein